MILEKNWLFKILTPKEIKVIKNRLQIIKLLKTDLSYRQIAKKQKVSTATIVKMNKKLKIRKSKNKKLKSLKKAKNKIPKYQKLSFLTSDRMLKKTHFNRQKSKIPWVIG